MDIESLKFPVGEFIEPTIITSEIIGNWINDIESFPKELIELVHNLGTSELGYAYRPQGWTIKQVVHHCVDSHINSYVRFKLALTEDRPTIRPYNQDAWVELADAQTSDLTDSIKVLTGLHAKWSYLLRSLSSSQLKRELIHPEHDNVLTVEYFIGLYAWHCNHHLGHIKQAIAHQGEFS